MMFKASIIFCLTLVIVSECRYTTVQKSFHLGCRKGMSIDRIRSVYNRTANDRGWWVGCRAYNLPTKENSTCHWTGYQNNYRQPLAFQCPGDGIIAGIASTYDKRLRDRKFRFYCCSIGDYVTHSCQYTTYINKFRQPFDYSIVFDEWYLRGVESVHVGGRDRQYQFEICQMDRIGGDPV